MDTQTTAPQTVARVAFGVAGYGPYWAPAVESWLRCVARASRELHVESLGGITGVGCTDRVYTSSAENRLAEGFLAIPDATHLFFTETDMILPDTAILDLLAMNVDIASGIYFLREGWGQPCLYRQVVKFRRRRVEKAGQERDWSLYAHSPVTLFPTDGPFKLGDKQASGVPGFGCVLFSRKVFETMTPPWFEIREGKCGSDMFFYHNAWQAGFDVWVHPSVLCDQIDYTTFTIEDYYDRLQEDPTFAASGYIIGSQRWHAAEAV